MKSTATSEIEKFARTDGLGWNIYRKGKEADPLIGVTCSARGISFEYALPETLPWVFLEAVEANPKQTAIAFGETTLNFEELMNASLHIANYIRQLGCGVDDCVGLFAESSIDQLVGLWGAILAGCAYTPLTPGYPSDRLKFMTEDAAIKIVFGQGKLQQEFSKWAPSGVKFVTLEDAYAYATSENKQHPTRMADRLLPDSLAYIVYTSGSTGKPKGVLIEHHSIVNQIGWLVRSGYLGPGKTIIHKTPIGFDAAQWEMLSVCSGTKLVVSTFGIDKNVNQLVADIAAHDVTLLQCVPTLLQALVNKPEFSTCISLKHILSGAESLTKKLVNQCLEALPNSMVVNLYGPSECTCNASFYEVTPSDLELDDGTAIPIGLPVDNTQFYILDENGLPVTGNSIGEICVSGSQIARGYLNREDLTNDRFVERPIGPNSTLVRIYRTGDLGYLGDRGLYYFAGRSDTQVKIKGMRIELEEVKIALESLDLIDSAAVMVVESGNGRKHLAACFQAKLTAEVDAQDMDSQEIIQSAKDLLGRIVPDYMIPSIFVLTPSMPHTVNGKIDMRKVQELFEAHGAEDYVAPRNPTEEAILAIWIDSLDISDISVRDDFFALGGDSMAAVDLILSINEKFNTSLPLHIIFNAPTIEALASLISEDLSVESSRVVCLQPRGTDHPIFCWPGLGGYPLNLRLLADNLSHTRPFYGIQAYGINEDEIPYDSLKEMVAADISEIRKIQGTGPYHLWGYSFGTNLAYEAAFQLEQLGEEVKQLVLLAPGMLKGLRTDDPSDEYSNPQLIALLFTVFARNVNDPDLEDCLEASRDEESFIDFICKKFAIPSRDLVKRICRIVIKSRKISRVRGREMDKVVNAESLMYCARNDELSVFETSPHYFSGALEIVHLDATHFDFLMAPDVEKLAALITQRLG